jgi:NAD(P)-dependent dehydrogenase (short-subunit alcohol dehydrogenase family)
MNIHSFYLSKFALPHMPSRFGSSIVLDASVNPSVAHPKLVDYIGTKGAMIGLARTLSNQIVG